MRAWVVQVKDGRYVHENPDYNLRHTGELQLTEDLEKAKTWQKPGMLQTYMKRWNSYVHQEWHARAIEMTRVIL